MFAFGRRLMARDLNYTFPYITRIEPVLTHIKDNPNFKLNVTPECTIIDYKEPEFPDIRSYSDEVLRELRGIAFNRRGAICSRPYHKFFNFKEREGTSEIDILRDHKIYHKIDGVMIRPLYLTGASGDYWRLASREGISNISIEAEKLIEHNDEYINFINHCRKLNYTPIFEYVSPSTKTIVQYPKNKLVLTAVRHMFSGLYQDFPKETKMDVVPCIEGKKIKDVEAFTTAVKLEEYTEGYVVALNNGHRVSIKTDWYMELDKVRDGLRKEKQILKLLLTGKLDDYLKTLPLEEKNKVIEFTNKAIENFLKMHKKLVELFQDIYFGDNLPTTKIEFSVDANKIEDKYRFFVYKAWDIQAKDKGYNIDNLEELKEEMTDMLYKACDGSKERYDRFKWLIGDVTMNTEKEEEQKVA